MTNIELIDARVQLRLNKTRMAFALGFSSYRPYLRLENGERVITPSTEILVRALLILKNTKHAKDFCLIQP